MGVDYYATALIGCEVPRDVFFRTVKKRGCRSELVEGAQFCPSCGKPTWIEEEMGPWEVLEDDHKLGLHLKGKAGEIVRFAFTTDEKRGFAGLYRIGAGDDAGRLPWPDRCVKEATREALEPLGLWDEESFGLWAVQYCSY